MKPIYIYRRRWFKLYRGPSRKWEGPFSFSNPVYGLKEGRNDSTEKSDDQQFPQWAS
jgi:hypothetical protein